MSIIIKRSIKKYIFLFVVSNSFISFSFSDLETIAEHDEPEEFWERLGGKEAYASMARLTVSNTCTTGVHEHNIFISKHSDYLNNH